MLVLTTTTTACGASDDLDGLKESDLTVRRNADGTLSLTVEVKTPRTLGGTEPSCPTVSATVSVDDGPPGPLASSGGVSSYTTGPTWVSSKKTKGYRCRDVAVSVAKPASRRTSFVIADGEDAAWHIDVEELRDETPLTITLTSDAPVREGDEVEVQVNRAVEGLAGTRLGVGLATGLVDVRWLAPDRFAFTMPHLERVAPTGRAQISVVFDRTFAPRVTRCDGPRACKFAGAVERTIHESPSTAWVTLAAP
jgi:hypothetical protein